MICKCKIRRQRGLLHQSLSRCRIDCQVWSSCGRVSVAPHSRVAGHVAPFSSWLHSFYSASEVSLIVKTSKHI